MMAYCFEMIHFVRQMLNIRFHLNQQALGLVRSHLGVISSMLFFLCSIFRLLNYSLSP